MPSILPNGKTQFLDINGRPLVNGNVFYYEPNTETPKTTYADMASTTPNPNPVVLDARGEAVIWGTGTYRQIVKDASGVTIWDQTVDTPAGGAALSSTTGAGGAALIGFDGDTLADFFLSKNNRVVDSIAALRTISKTTYTRAFVTGYYAAGDGGGGAYWYDPTDTTSADNGGTIIVASDGGRWKLTSTSVVTLKQFGAKGDGTTDDTSAFNAALSVITSILRIPAGKYKISSAITVANSFGLTIEGDGASVQFPGTTYENNSVLIFDSAAAGSDGLYFNTFVGLTLKNIVISQRRSAAGGGRGLYLRAGHDFRLENIVVDSSVGNGGAGIVLGDGTGAGAAFQGVLTACKVLTTGEAAFSSNPTNTSLTFNSCYAIGGACRLDGTTYSVLNACASDGAPLFGYEINNCQAITLNSVGAEACGRGAIYISQSSSNIVINAPLGANNNSSAQTQEAALVQIDSSIGSCFGITITAPTSLYANAASVADISANAGTGRVTINDVTSAKMPKGVSGDSTWILANLMMTGDIGVRNFTPTQGTGWSFTGTPVFSGTFVRYGNKINFVISITGYTNVSVASGATILLPFAPSVFGSTILFDDNAAQLGTGIITSDAKLYVPVISSRTVPLHLIGEFIAAN